MKKLIIAYLFTITNVFAAPPTYFNGELQTNTYIQNIKAPNYQTTPLGGIDRRLETGNLNELQNPNFEHSTVGTGWTISNATVSGNTANPLEGKKSISLALTGALSLSQSSTINAARKSGVQMVASVWVNSSDVSDLQLCSLKNGAEDKCTVTGGYVQGSGWRQLTVSFIGNATSNGLKLKSTDTTGTVLVDQAFVGVGSPIVDFTPDMVFSAQISSTGVVSAENTDWINGNCAVTGTGNYECSYISGLVTQPMNCVAISGSQWDIAKSTNTNVLFRMDTSNPSGVAAASDFSVLCQKQGADYKTSKAYVASSSDTDWTPCTFSTLAWQGLGTVTNNLLCSRKGSSLKMKGRVTLGTVSSSQAQIPLPTNYGTITTASNIPSSSFAAGIVFREIISANTVYSVIQIPSVSYLAMSGQLANTTINPNEPSTGSGMFSNGNTLSIPELSIPIQGWTDSGVIVGSFEGIEKCATANECNDTFSAKVSSAGVVSEENTDFINGNGVVTSTSTYTFTFSSNIFTVAPNCTVTSNDAANGYQVRINSVSSTTLVVVTAGLSGGMWVAAASPFSVMCQKQGVDYHPKTAKIALPFGEVSARYTQSSGQSIPTSSPTVVDFNTKVYDSHNAVTTGSSWRFTAPISGEYSVVSTILFASSAWPIQRYSVIYLRKNGVNYAATPDVVTQVAQTMYFGPYPLTTKVKLLQGEYIDIVLEQNRGSATSMHNASTNNWVEINRVGNY